MKRFVTLKNLFRLVCIAGIIYCLYDSANTILSIATGFIGTIFLSHLNHSIAKDNAE